MMPVFRPTADCIWKSFRSSQKKHLVLTGIRGSGKTTLFHALFPAVTEGLTTWAVPEKGVYLKNNRTGETIQIGRFDPDLSGTENRMQPVLESFCEKGTSFFNFFLNSSESWITIDEIGYLENHAYSYQNAVKKLLTHKHVLMVIRKQNLDFLNELQSRSDVFAVDLDQPYGNAGCIIMASGQGTRFGGNKLLEAFHGKPLIQWALDATAGLFSRRLVVTVHKEIEQLCQKQAIPVLLHHLPFRNDVIRLGLEAIGNDVDRCAFLPSDQPLLRPESICSLLLCAKNHPDFIWRPCYEAFPGSPVIFPASFFEDLKTLPPKKGGNLIIQEHPDAVKTVPASSIYELKDIDTQEDWQRMTQVPHCFFSL